MSSHREAPEISKDPVADNTDVYAFVSPDNPQTVTLISNFGPRSTPSYAALGEAAVHSLPGGVKVFAGQRNDGFYVDLGAIFDLGDLRPFQNLHLIPSQQAAGVDATKTLNIHTIALQVP